MTGSTPMEEKQYVKSQNIVKTDRRQEDLPYFLSNKLMSVGGNRGGVRSSSQRHWRSREIDNQLSPKQIWRSGMEWGRPEDLQRAVPTDTTWKGVRLI